MVEELGLKIENIAVSDLGKAKRINITFPERALSELDSCAKAIGESRSRFLLRAALEFIARRGAA